MFQTEIKFEKKSLFIVKNGKKTDFDDFSIVNVCVCYSTKTVFHARKRVRHVHPISKWISTYYHIWKD